MSTLIDAALDAFGKNAATEEERRVLWEKRSAHEVYERLAKMGYVVRAEERLHAYPVRIDGLAIAVAHRENLLVLLCRKWYGGSSSGGWGDANEDFASLDELGYLLKQVSAKLLQLRPQ